MSVVEAERHGQILVVRMSRPERLDARTQEMRWDGPRVCCRLPTLDGLKD